MWRNNSERETNKAFSMVPKMWVLELRKKGKGMAFVVLQPNSLTNHSDKYRVVDSKSWAAFVNKAIDAVAVAGEFDTYPEAKEERDRLNN